MNVDDQHDCQASVGSNVLLRKPARMRVALHSRHCLCIGSSPDSGDSFLPVGVSTGIRAARARSRFYLPVVTCPEPKVADLDFKFAFLCGFDTSALVALPLVCQD